MQGTVRRIHPPSGRDEVLAAGEGRVGDPGCTIY